MLGRWNHPDRNFQPTKLKGYIWMFTLVGAEHLSHSIQTVLLLYVIGQRVGTMLYISKEVYSLRMHGGTSNALICVTLTLQQ